MNIKRILSVILTTCVVSVIASLPVSAQTTTEGAYIQIAEEQQDNAKTTESFTNEFAINNKKDFSKFMTTPKYWENNYKITLTCDLDMQDETFGYIETFSGQFDGGSHTISNLSFKCFVKTNNGTISGVKFKNGKLIDDSNIQGSFVDTNKGGGVIDNCSVDMNSEDVSLSAGFVCYNYGTITNSETTLSVKNGGDYAGGFVNDNDGTIKNCTAIGNITGRSAVGGFVGHNSGEITACIARGDVIGNEVVGGFVGYNNYFGTGIIIACSATGDVTGNNYLGGFAGYNYNRAATNYVTITECSATGNVTGNYAIGGFIGFNEGTKITNCTAIGNVTGTGDYVGGFVGINELLFGSSNYKGTIENCKATGTVTSNDAVGGFVGYNSGIITNCTATGNKNSNYCVGGFVARNGGTITDCTATGNITGNHEIGGFVVQNFGTITNCTAAGNVNGKKISLDIFAGENVGKIEDCKIA